MAYDLNFTNFSDKGTHQVFFSTYLKTKSVTVASTKVNVSITLLISCAEPFIFLSNLSIPDQFYAVG